MNYRLRTIQAVTFLGGLYFVLVFLLPDKIGSFEISSYNTPITNAFNAVGVMALGLGLCNLLSVHGTRVLFLKKGWFQSIALLLGLAAMISVTWIDWRRSARIAAASERYFSLSAFIDRIIEDENKGAAPLPLATRVQALKVAIESEGARLTQEIKDTPASSSRIEGVRVDLISQQHQLTELTSQIPEDRLATEELQKLSAILSNVGALRGELLTAGAARSIQKGLYTVLYQGLFVSLGSAMFSLLGFYIATAAYRAFRVRSWESALMMTAALVVMLGQMPFADYISESLPAVRLWLLRVPNSAAFRAIEIGAAIAGLVMAFRMWLSIESQSFSNEKDRA
jgi:hypothetical protein